LNAARRQKKDQLQGHENVRPRAEVTTAIQRWNVRRSMEAKWLLINFLNDIYSSKVAAFGDTVFHNPLKIQDND
jgi:hypothetical protein